MKCAGTFRALLCRSLVVLVALGAYAVGANGSQEVSGFYKVVNTTDLGTEVRVTLDVRLFNATDGRLFITKASLHVFPHSRLTAEEPVSAILEAHGNSEFRQEFTVSHEEYEFWKRGVRLRVALRIQVAGSPERTLVVVLVRRPG